jgi:hypothetical protein
VYLIDNERIIVPSIRESNVVDIPLELSTKGWHRLQRHRPVIGERLYAANLDIGEVW